MEYAKGKFISFVDSDDYIDSDYLEKLLGVICKEGADWVCCDFKKVDTENPTIISKMIEEYTVVKDEKIIVADYLEGYHYPRVVWGKLFRRDIIVGSRFPDFSIGEDTCFVFQIINKSGVVVKINYQGYNYSYRPESSTRTKLFTNKELDRITHLDFIASCIEKKMPDESNRIRASKVRLSISLYTIAQKVKVDDSIKQAIIAEIKKETAYYKKLSLKLRFKLLMLTYFPFVYDHLLLMIS